MEEGTWMNIDLVFKIAAIGILVAVLYQLLVRSGREDMATMASIAGLVIVLLMVVELVGELFDTVKTIFGLYLIKSYGYFKNCGNRHCVCCACPEH